MKAVRSGANLNKEDKQTKRKNNLLAACACALLVVCLCISKGIFGTEENEALKNETDSENTAISDITPIENLYGDSNAEATKKPSGHKAQTASFTDVYGTVYETDNAALIAELENLLAPAKNSEFAPKEYPTYQLVMDYGDSYLSMDIYVESELVFADKGEGPYPVTGDADEFNTLIKNVGQG